MKYLTMTFAIAFMAFGFASIKATPVQANESWECAQDGGQLVARSGHDDECVYPSRAEIDGVDSLQQVAIRDDDKFEDCSITKENPDGVKLCVVTDENGNERVAGIEVPDGVEFAGRPDKYDWSEACAKGQCTPSGYKAEEAGGEQVAGGLSDYCRRPENSLKRSCLPVGNSAGEDEREQVAGGKRDWNQHIRKDEEAEGEQVAGGPHRPLPLPTKTPTGTFYPLPMIDVASMDKLLAPGGTSVASFDKILAPGGTAVESDYQFADREDGSGGDFGESGGGDFGEGDRAAASTAAE